MPVAQSALVWFGLIACGGLCIAGLIKGLTGIGYTTCALPILATVMDLKSAICATVLPALVSSLVLSLKAVDLADTIKRFRTLYVGLIVGIVAGLAVILLFDGGWAKRILGLITIAYTLFALGNPDTHLPARFEEPLKLPVGLSNGFLTGLTGSQIIPLMPYLMALRLEPERLVQATNTSVIVGSAAMAIGLFTSGLMTVELAFISLLGVLPATLGVSIGNNLRRHVHPTLFRKIVLLVMMLMGLSLLPSYS